MIKTDDHWPDISNYIEHIDDVMFECVETAKFYSGQVENAITCDRGTAQAELYEHGVRAGVMSLIYSFNVEALKTKLITPLQIATCFFDAQSVEPATILRAHQPSDFYLDGWEFGCLQPTLSKYAGAIIYDLAQDYMDELINGDVTGLPHLQWINSLAFSQALIQDSYANNKVTPDFQQSVVFKAAEDILTRSQAVDGERDLDADVRDMVLLPIGDYFAINQLTLSGPDYANPHVRTLAQTHYDNRDVPDKRGNAPAP